MWGVYNGADEYNIKQNQQDGDELTNRSIKFQAFSTLVNLCSFPNPFINMFTN